MSIVSRLGLENLRRLARPRFIDASHPDFIEALDTFVANCSRTEKRRHGERGLDQIREHCIRGLVAEFALKKVQGVAEHCPLVPDLSLLDVKEMHTDVTFEGHRFQVKSRTNVGGRYWTVGQSQYNSIMHSMHDNDFFIVVGVKKEQKNTWLAVPELVIDSRKIFGNFRKSSYNDWSWYFDTKEKRMQKHCVLLTQLLKPDSIDEMKECA